ncbi:MAG: histidine phosphatase family protein [Acidimicrobiia bacterium]
MSDPAQLLLVRHGQSTWNADGRWQGTEDPPLSTLGVRQARHAASRLGAFDAVVASPLERAFVTATILADELGIGPVQVDDDLRERCAGEYQGLTRDQIEHRFPGYLAEGLRPPGWEEDDSVLERAAGALARVALDVGPGGTALVVSHGGVIHTLERATGAQRSRRLPNLGGRWFEVGPGRLEAGDEVLLVDEDEVTVPRQL